MLVDGWERWAENVWWFGVIGVVIGLVNLTLLGYLVWLVKSRLRQVDSTTADRIPARL